METYQGWKPIPDEPDFKEFWIETSGFTRIKRHHKSRLNKKYRKKFGYKKVPMTFHGVIVRHSFMGHLNGYLGVPKSSVFYEKEFICNPELNDVFARLITHGGVTHASDGKHFKIGLDEYWYIGFDAAHAGDIVPSFFRPEKSELSEVLADLAGMLNDFYETNAIVSTYKDMKFMERKIRGMALQLTEFDLSMEAKDHGLHDNVIPMGLLMAYSDK